MIAFAFYETSDAGILPRATRRLQPGGMRTVLIED
jgi:hypothetical protein